MNATHYNGVVGSMRPRGKNADIEVLRAIAILFVVVHHLGFLFPWDGHWRALFIVSTYWSGVDLFFCVSGFVIANSFLKEAQGASFYDFAVPFWIKRVWRIWPAAIFWLVIAIAASKIFNASGAFGPFKGNIADGVAALMQVANFHFLNCWFYKAGMCGNEGIYWSLSLEDQFYFVFPFLVFFLPRKWLVPTLIVAILLQAFWHRPMATPLWMTRTDAICYGVLIALASGTNFKAKLYPYFLRSRGSAIAFSAVLIFLLSAIPTGDVVWFDTGLLALVAAVLVFAASYDERFILPVPFLAGPLAWVGSRSFAIYLTHTVSFWATQELFHRLYPGTIFDESFTFEFVVVGFALIVLLSEGTYRLIEVPLREKGRNIAAAYGSRRRKVPNDAGDNVAPAGPATFPVAGTLPLPQGEAAVGADGAVAGAPRAA